MEPSPIQIDRSPHTFQRGIALVIVLCLLVLISGIVVAFFSSVSSEYLTAKSASAGATGKELADASVQMVMGQIRKATSQGSNICWASQPGMIRTWGDAGGIASANKLAYYKLYSSNNMVVSAASGQIGSTSYDPITNPMVDLASQPAKATSDWYSYPAIFTDLNAPITTTSGTKTYPIIDGNGLTPLGTGTSTYVTGNNPTVDGFAILTSATGYAPGASANANPVPMPVKWIYVLRNGTLVAPDATSPGSSATFSGSNVPTAINPIVGRIAFWTDDETCKLNINTACGGAPWDQPMFNNGLDICFSRYQPAAHEYTRYPGHPAGTSLSPVFWSFSSMTSPDYNLAPSPTYPASGGMSNIDWAPTLLDNAKDYWQKMLRLSPRNELGDISTGSQGGSQMGVKATAGSGVTGAGGGNGVGYACPVDSDRLYSSVDELMFTPARVGRNQANTYEFQLNKAALEKVRFFLTATSRAPEVNPFNQPKVALWPVPDPTLPSVANSSASSASTRSPSDQLIAFCSTLNNNPYYFTRYDATSGTNDFSTRNSAIYTYLNNQLSKPVPGFGGTFSTRYGTQGSAQILTEIYDYIRSCINLQDGSAGTDGDAFTTRMKWSYTTLPAVIPNKPITAYGMLQAGCGQVLPFYNSTNGTKGLGRFPTIKQVSIMFIARGADQPPLQVNSLRRPLIYDASGNSLLDGDGNLKAAGVTAVLGGLAKANANDMHPFTADAVVTQLVSGTTPVLAVNETKLAANPNDITAIYPIFNVQNAYPTICTSGGSDAVVQVGVSGSAQTMTYGGNTYSYYKACQIDSGGKAISSTTRPPQTHSGLEYLTLPRLAGSSVAGNMEGAYDLPNPRYQIANNAQKSLNPYQTQIEAVFFIDPVNNAPGFESYCANYRVRIRGLEKFSADSNGLGFPSNVTETAQYQEGGAQAWLGGGSTYDVGALTHLSLRTIDGTGITKLNFVSQPQVVGNKDNPSNQGATFSFGGSDIISNGVDTLTIDILPPATAANADTPVQTYNIKFPSETFPTPKLPFLPQYASMLKYTGQSATVNYSYLTSGTLSYPPKDIVALTPSTVLTFLSGSSYPLSSNPNFVVSGSNTSSPPTRSVLWNVYMEIPV